MTVQNWKTCAPNKKNIFSTNIFSKRNYSFRFKSWKCGLGPYVMLTFRYKRRKIKSGLHCFQVLKSYIKIEFSDKNVFIYHNLLFTRNIFVYRRGSKQERFIRFKKVQLFHQVECTSLILNIMLGLSLNRNSDYSNKKLI